MPKELTIEQKAKLDDLESPDLVEQQVYKWDKDFQREILALIVFDRQFLIEVRPIVKPIYFTEDAHRIVCSILFHHFDKYKVMPTKVQLLQELRSVIAKETDDIKAYTVQEFHTLNTYYNPGLESREYYRDKITNFAKIQALKVAFHDCVEAIKKNPEGDETWATVQETLNVAMTVDHSFDMGLDYFETYKERYQRMNEKIEKGEIFTSGFKAIDDALSGGGLSRGELGSWVGLSGSGKSLGLVCSALANMAKGKKVLYISLEIDKDRVAERFDAQLSDPEKKHGLTINNLYEKKDIVFQSLEEYLAINKELQPRLVVKQFPGGSMGMAEFRAYYAQLVLNGFSPDLIIIDYIGEMKDYPGIPVHESRYRITRDLRGFAVEEQVCVLTAMQPNRSAKEAIKSGLLIDDENLGDSYAQIKPLDAMWTINQLQEEKECGLARIFVAKHRNGKSRFTFYIQFDYDILSMKQISKEKYEQILKNYRMTKDKTVDDAMVEEIQLQNKLRAIDGNKKNNPPLKNFFKDDIGEVEEQLPEELK